MTAFAGSPGPPDPAWFKAATSALRAYWSGRECVLLSQTAGGPTHTLTTELESHGARVKALVTAGPGKGGEGFAEHTWNFAERGSQLGREEFDEVVESPPAALANWLDALDPHRTWTVVGTTRSRSPRFCGRQVHGHRRPSWSAWEDKTRIDELWREAGIPAPEHVVVAADDPELPSHVARLDRGLGVVLAIDASAGLRGDATGLRRVRDPQDLAAARRWFEGRTRLLRVAEFVEGVPCSVLGMVLADGVAVFDPIEILTLRNGGSGLVFCGSSTHWRPGRRTADRMRGYTRSAGELLAARGFRAMFSVDGVLTRAGFLATELNPRAASGLGLRTGWPGFPAYLFQRAAQEALPGVFDVPARAIETSFRSVVRKRPSHTVHVPLTPPVAPGARRIEVTTSDGLSCVAGYRVANGALELASVHPLPGSGRVAPAAAAVATALGTPFDCAADVMRRSHR